MDKIKKPEGKTTDVLAMLLIKQDEIVDWINEQTEEIKHLWTNLIDLQKEVLKIRTWINKNKKAIEWVNEFQKMFYDCFEQMLLQYEAKGITDKAQAPKITRYELSNDKVGLIAHLADGNSYHIHSNELTPEQRSIRIELLGMEGK